MKKGSSTYAGADTGVFDFSVSVLLEGSQMEEYTSSYVNCAKWGIIEDQMRLIHTDLSLCPSHARMFPRQLVATCVAGRSHGCESI